MVLKLNDTTRLRARLEIVQVEDPSPFTRANRFRSYGTLLGHLYAWYVKGRCTTARCPLLRVLILPYVIFLS